jgi:hypothetical protein
VKVFYGIKNKQKNKRNCQVPAHAVKADREALAQLRPFFSSALREAEWSTSLSGRFTPGKEPPSPVA